MRIDIVVDMMRRYATSELGIPEVAKEYEITVSRFNQLQDEAIIKAWVDIKTVLTIKEKIKKLQKKDSNLIFSLESRYDYLIKERRKRQEFKLTEFEDEKELLKFEIEKFEERKGLENEMCNILNELNYRLDEVEEKIKNIKEDLNF